MASGYACEPSTGYAYIHEKLKVASVGATHESHDPMRCEPSRIPRVTMRNRMRKRESTGRRSAFVATVTWYTQRPYGRVWRTDLLEFACSRAGCHERISAQSMSHATTAPACLSGCTLRANLFYVVVSGHACARRVRTLQTFADPPVQNGSALFDSIVETRKRARNLNYRSVPVCDHTIDLSISDPVLCHAGTMIWRAEVLAQLLIDGL